MRSCQILDNELGRRDGSSSGADVVTVHVLIGDGYVLFRVLIDIERNAAVTSRYSGSVMTRRLTFKSRAALMAVVIACPLAAVIVSPAQASATMYLINEPILFD